MPEGKGSADTEKSWYWPGRILPPLQVTSDTAVLNEPSSVTIGLARVIVCTETCQPGTGLASSWAIGWLVGICTCISMVAALASSLGTRKVTSAVDPCAADPGVIVMCARAVPASAASAIAQLARTMAPRAPVRAMRRDNIENSN